MSYNINQAISFCNLTTGRKKKDIRNDIIIELGGDPNNDSDQVEISRKISGSRKGLTKPQFKAICKACECPAYVLAGMDS